MSVPDRVRSGPVLVHHRIAGRVRGRAEVTPRWRRQWAWLAPIGLLVLLPQFYGLALAPSGAAHGDYAVALLGVSATVLALASASVLCCHWWITLNQGTAWAGVGLLALSIALLPFRLVGLDPTTYPSMSTPATIADDAVALAVALVILSIRTIEFRRKVAPIVLGTLVGLVFGAVGMLYTAVQFEEWADVPQSPWWLGQALAVVLGAAIVAAVGRMVGLPRWARRRFQTVAVLVTAGWAAECRRCDGRSARAPDPPEVVAGTLVVLRSRPGHRDHHRAAGRRPAGVRAPAAGAGGPGRARRAGGGARRGAAARGARHRRRHQLGLTDPPRPVARARARRRTPGSGCC